MKQRLGVRPGSFRLLRYLPFVLLFVSLGCQKGDVYPANYREYVYVSNGGSNTVTVLDLVNMRQDRVVAVGTAPSALAVNPLRNEVYAVNSGSDSVTAINSETNQVVATIPVGHRPTSIDLDATGERAYIANAASNNVSVIDLRSRRVVGVAGAGESPVAARVTRDGKTLVIANQASGSVSIADTGTLKIRSSFDHCPGAGDVMLLPDSSKAFVACAQGHQIMVVGLAHTNGGDPRSADVLLTFLDVGKSPVHISLKPDGGEAFVSNSESDTISELTTSFNEVGGAYLVGAHPVRGLVSSDNSLLYVCNYRVGQIGIYSIDDGKLIGPGVKVGEGPTALAFSGSGHLLFVVDTLSGDIAVVKTGASPSLLTMFPAGKTPNDIAIKAFLVH